jgi:hypothetical protein
MRMQRVIITFSSCEAPRMLSHTDHARARVGLHVGHASEACALRFFGKSPINLARTQFTNALNPSWGLARYSAHLVSHT